MHQITGWLHTRKHKILAGISLFFILAAGFCLYQALVSPLKESISIGGVEVGGLTPVQARKTLETALEETLLTQSLAVQLPEETLLFSPEDCNFRIQMSKALLHARHAEVQTAIPLKDYLDADTDYILGKLEAYAAIYDTSLTQPVWQLERTAPQLSTEVFSPEDAGQTLAITLGLPELHLDCDAVLAEILQTAANAVPLCKNQQYYLTPELIPEALPNPVDTDAIANEYRSEPVNDAVDMATYSLLHGSYGTALDAEQLSEEIAKAAFGETVRIPIQYLPPEILGEEAYYLDVLGSCETRHTNDPNRNHNLQLQCDTLNGFVLQPGETFSMNEVLGERTVERGYKPAPAYSGNRLVNSPGGGVCQGSTTLYNCVLLADLEVVFRACHGAKVGYVPLGLDCAINYLTTDFQFKNNFHFPIQIRAWMEDGYMKMQILGTDEKDYYIKMETGSGEDERAWYARSFKCKYDKETNELISREVEAYSTYYKDIG